MVPRVVLGSIADSGVVDERGALMDPGWACLHMSIRIYDQ